MYTHHLPRTFILATDLPDILSNVKEEWNEIVDEKFKQEGEEHRAWLLEDERVEEDEESWKEWNANGQNIPCPEDYVWGVDERCLRWKQDGGSEEEFQMWYEDHCYKDYRDWVTLGGLYHEHQLWKRLGEYWSGREHLHNERHENEFQTATGKDHCKGNYLIWKGYHDSVMFRLRAIAFGWRSHGGDLLKTIG